jgi:hypothetical protein
MLAVFRGVRTPLARALAARAEIAPRDRARRARHRPAVGFDLGRDVRSAVNAALRLKRLRADCEHLRARIGSALAAMPRTGCWPNPALDCVGLRAVSARRGGRQLSAAGFEAAGDVRGPGAA